MRNAVARLLQVSLCLSLTAGALTAQGGGAHWVDVGQQPPLFGRSAGGDFDADGVPDVVTLRGDQLEVVLGPGLFDVHLEQIAQAQGFCVCPAAGGDVLLVSGPWGLVSFVLDVASESWVPTLISSLWADAPLVVQGTNGAGQAEIVGAMSDGRSLRRATHTVGGWLDEPLFTLPVPARDLALVQFDGTGSLEIAVATAGALGVFDPLGALRASWAPGGVSSVGIGRLEQPGTPRDWIAWMVTLASGAQELRVVGQPGALPPVGMAPTAQIVDIATGDIDGDGRGDVIFSHTTLHHVVHFYDRGDGETPLFDYSLPGTLVLVPIGPANTPAPNNRARPTLADVDGDGDVDTLMPVQSTGKVFVGRNAAIDEDALEPRVDLLDPLVCANLVALPGGELALDLKLELEEPLPAGATHVELIAWRRDDPLTPTAPAACERVLVPLGAGVPAGGTCKLDASLVLPPPPDLIPGTNVRFEGIYLWLQRPVKVEAGAITCCWPARVYALETNTSSVNHDWIVSIGGVPTFPVHEKQNGSTIPDQIGCGSELPCLPPFPPGKLPKWN